MRICAITNVLDEDFNLPIWLNHYGRELGPENCIIVDRGSHKLPALTTQSVLQTHRLPLDENRRARTISSLTNTMLEYYDVVLYTDCDELLVPDPGAYSGLRDFFARTDARTYTAAGVEVVHKLDEEDPLDVTRPLLSQRAFCGFNSWMCKTAATRDPIWWGGGFHASSQPPVFNGLYLFHTKLIDFGEALKRAAQLRQFDWADGMDPSYHRYPPLFTVNVIRAAVDLGVEDFDAAVVPMTEQALRSAEKAPNDLYYLKEEVRPRCLFRIPERFRTAF
jgi:hypothetical protein